MEAIVAGRSHRIDSIDLLRGLVMVIMALDHVRDFFHREAMTEDPLNFATTSPILFLTRWITHFCAPVFVFLAGVSAYLQGARKPKKELSAFLIKRGLWLILVEVTLISFAFTFDVRFSFLGLQTIWAIGISMVLLGLAIWLPYAAILTLGLLIVAGHNLLDYYEQGKQEFSIAYSLVHRPGFFPIGNNRFLGILYPFLPWTGLMLTGYCAGRLFRNLSAEKRQRLLWLAGGGLLLLFALLRAPNLYGDPSPWQPQQTRIFTALSFINVTKYPPSLLYLCLTIGPGLIFLAAANGVRNGFTRFLTVFGRVPFLYYILHFYLIHLLTGVFYLLSGHRLADAVAGSPDQPFLFVIPGQGYSLGVVYLLWIGVVLALYPVCRWFSRYKETHRQWWLSYL
jgi:uncharacterized membrane protein